MLTWRNIAIVLVALVAVSLAAGYLADGMRWRMAVLGAKLSGRIPELPMADLLAWLRPGSPVYLGHLADSGNVHAAIRNLDMSAAAAEEGRVLIARHCAHCHGTTGEGGAGPNLVAAVRGGLSDWAFFSAVKRGVAGTSMGPQSVTDREAWRAHAYVAMQARTARDEMQQALAAAPRPVSAPFDAIANRADHAADWLTYGGTYSGHRHTPLAAIDRKNVRDLRIAWVAQLRAADAYLEASPIVRSSRIFVTESPDGLVSLDAGTGELLWRFRRPVPPNIRLCCGSPNRGAAILGDALYLQTLDAHVVSLDAATGAKRWEVKLADYRDGYSMTGAPLALRDRVVVGVSGGLLGIRGFVSALRASDGHRLWTFHTVPAPGEPGNETWSGDSWKTGGAATWATGAYDPGTNTLFWGVGNPAPAFQGDQRLGANLFSGSVVALDADAGALRWHYQFTPSDEHDWDSAQQPVLADISWRGVDRAVMLWANRNGFFYVLDRTTGEFLLAKPFVKQTWTSGFRPDGSPILREEARPSRQGTLVWPWAGGATNWWPPSFDAGRLLLFVSTVDAAGVYYREPVRYRRGEFFLGGASFDSPTQPALVAVKAIDVTTGEIRWEHRLAQGLNTHNRVGGVLSTATGLVFVGYRDEFLALDADTGRELKRFRLGGQVHAPPVSYEVGGKQHVAVMAGRALFSFALP